MTQMYHKSLQKTSYMIGSQTEIDIKEKSILLEICGLKASSWRCDPLFRNKRPSIRRKNAVNGSAG